MDPDSQGELRLDREGELRGDGEVLESSEDDESLSFPLARRDFLGEVAAPGMRLAYEKSTRRIECLRSFGRLKRTFLSEILR